MTRHREHWQARKKQSEGKLRSLKKKVDTLDELVIVAGGCEDRGAELSWKFCHLYFTQTLLIILPRLGIGMSISE